MDPDRIPVEFHSEYTDQPFTHCIDCGGEFSKSDDERFYTIFKSFVGNEAVFEMAICAACAEKIREEYSEETRTNLEMFFKQRMPHLAEQLNQDSDPERSLEEVISVRIDACASCAKPRSECHRYEIMGVFFANRILQDLFKHISQNATMMLCEDCVAEAAPLISKKTRDFFDRFIEEHFDGPPGIELDSPRFEPILF